MASSEIATDDGFDIPGFGRIVEVGGDDKPAEPVEVKTKVSAKAEAQSAEVAKPEAVEAEGDVQESPEAEDVAVTDEDETEPKAETPPAPVEIDAKAVVTPDQAYGTVSQVEAELARVMAEARELAAEEISTDPLAYESDAAYQQALATNAVREREMARLKSRYDRLLAAKSAARGDVWEAQKKAASAKYKDFDAVMSAAGFKPTPAMAEAIVATPKGAEIAYHLSKNPDLGAKIAAMSPVEAAIAIGRLESQIEAPPKRTTQAPPPPPTNSGGRAVVQRSSIDKSSISDLKRALRESYN